MREPTRRELEAWDREHVWHAFTQMAEYEPCIFTHGHGATLVDIDGHEYLDAVSSLWCNLHGHRHPKLDAALREQLDRVAHTTLLGASNPTTIKLARRLVEIAPEGLHHVFFSDDGATAVEVALKMAFQYWRQRKNPQPAKATFVAFAEGYHGDTLGSVSVGGVERFHRMFEPLLFETIRLPVPDSYRLPASVTAQTATEHYAQQLERVLAEQHQRIAAVIVEPLIQAAAGMIMHPPGFLRRLRELTRRYDVLLIADEVAVGFGRTGKMFACEHEEVAPDFLCLAKGITGGYLPLAATITTGEIWQAFLGTHAESKTFYHGHTYGGNPLGAAVALANLEIFEEEETLDQLKPKIARLGEHLARLAQHPHVGDARQRGLIAGIELVQHRATKESFPFAERRGAQVCAAAKKQGVYLRPLGDVLVVMPPLSVTIEELDRIMHAIEAGIREQFDR